MQKILIFGASGLVGRAIIEEFRNGFDLFGTYSTSFTSLPDEKQCKLEIQEIDKMKEMIRSMKPDIVISCLRGEFDQQFKFHKALAMELAKYKSRLYYFSTTNVFDGDYSRPHTESDHPVSETAYGKFKIECKNMLKEILNDQVITIRIPAIWGKDSPRWNLIKESIKNNKMIDVYSNLVCSNLSDVLLAKQLRFIIEKELKGIFHLGSVDMMTQGQFYEEILRKLGIDTSILRYHLFQDQADTYYFKLSSDRDDVSSSLQCKNEEIIAYLMG